MSLIGIAVYDTIANRRTEFTRKTLNSLLETVDFYKHRIILVDNGSCEDTQHVLLNFAENCAAQGAQGCVEIIRNEENIGTAKAINKAWKYRAPGQHCIKMDNDVVIHEKGWIEQMEFTIRKQPEIGIIGLKRKDLMEFPGHPDENFRSQLLMVPHERGERWVVIEAVGHVIGTCQMYSSALLDKIGYLWQPGLYGFDDVLAAYRSHAAGFWNAFLPHIEIDHIDPGGDDYTVEKSESVRPYVEQVHIRGHEYLNHQRPVWEDA